MMRSGGFRVEMSRVHGWDEQGSRLRWAGFKVEMSRVQGRDEQGSVQGRDE